MEKRLNGFLIYVIFFLSFLGFYCILLLTVNSGLSGFTRQATVPLRGLIALSLIVLLLRNVKTIIFYPAVRWFIFFAAVYLLRVTIDYNINEKYYMPITEVYLYFFSFSIIPFLTLSTFRQEKIYFDTIINSIFASGFIFSIMVVVFYSRFIGQVGRLASSTAGEEVLSPLALSYCATLIIGTLGTYLIYNQSSIYKKAIGISSIVLSTVPFFLGASRGSLFALFLPILMMFIARTSIKSSLRILFVGCISFVLLVYLDERFQSGLLNRFLGTSSAMEQGSGGALRIQIWKNSFSQFLDNPIFGDKLKVNDFSSYPHNLFLEVLQTTGIIGFIPFCLLVLSAIKICFILFKRHLELSWIAVIFIQCFVHNMFSGALYTAVWFWSSMGLLFSVKYFLGRISTSYRTY